MLSNETVKNLKVVQIHNVNIDGDMVNIMGKIGETKNFDRRIREYKSCNRKTGMYGQFEDSKSRKMVGTVNRSNMTLNIINLRLFSLACILPKQ